MADTLTPNLKLTNQTEGGNASTWGIKVDDNFEQIDDKLGDITSIITTGGTTVLTDEQELVAHLRVSGTLVSNATIELSGRGGFWIVANDTTGAFTVTVKVTGETGIQVAQGTATLVWCDGDDIRQGVPTAEVVADTTPQLGGDLDTNGFDIQFDDNHGIGDDAGRDLLLFSKAVTAVNRFHLSNAATGNAPRLSVVGSDTNVDMDLRPQGTGGIIASFKQGTGLGLKDSDSSHDLKVKTSSNLTADRTLDFVTGDADRSITLGGNLNVAGAATVPAGTALVAGNNLSDVGNAATARGNLGLGSVVLEGPPARAYAEYTANADLTTAIPIDDTIPQNTEGTEIVTAAVTLKRASSRVRVRFQTFGRCVSGAGDDNRNWTAALFVDSTADALAAVAGGIANDNSGTSVVASTVLEFEHAPGSVGPFTYKIRVGPASGNTLRLNGTSSRFYGGAAKATLVAEEVYV
jgi:hypothetical protein